MLLTYFILMLDRFRLVSGLFIALSSVAIFALMMIIYAENIKKFIPYLKISMYTFIISVIIATFTPTTKQAALIFLSGQEDVVATAKNLPKLTKLGTDYLIELLEEGKKDGKEDTSVH